jgi:hypothetical protein
MANPDAIRRVDEQMHNDSPSVGGFAIRRNPGVTMLWTCTDYSVYDDGQGGKLIQMGEPSKVEWYACGKPATREQVVSSIESGLPALITLAQQQNGALKLLDECRERFNKWLPHVVQTLEMP